MAEASRTVCTAEVIMRAHARYGPASRPSAVDLATIWALVGEEIGAQLEKRRGVRLEGLGGLVLTCEGVKFQRERAAQCHAPHAQPSQQARSHTGGDYSG